MRKWGMASKCFLRVKIQSQRRLQCGQRHLVYPEGAHERIVFNLVNEICAAGDDATLGPPQQFVATEECQISTGSQTVAGHRFVIEAPLGHVNQSARAYVIHDRDVAIPSKLN